ncbi:MAG: hypothetical protein IJN35_01050 [Muribaculaceae bacterium]|nr:hypothetical protein [Muribaculaceae bacterium]
MKKGYLAHYCCCGNTTHKQSVVYVDNNRLYSIERFVAETPCTTFYDGLLIVVSPTFHSQRDTFIEQLQERLTKHSQLTITEAIQQIETYNNHPVAINGECLIYTLSPITWHTLRPINPKELRINLIK